MAIFARSIKVLRPSNRYPVPLFFHGSASMRRAVVSSASKIVLFAFGSDALATESSEVTPLPDTLHLERIYGVPILLISTRDPLLFRATTSEICYYDTAGVARSRAVSRRNRRGRIVSYKNIREGYRIALDSGIKATTPRNKSVSAALIPGSSINPCSPGKSGRPFGFLVTKRANKSIPLG